VGGKNVVGISLEKKGECTVEEWVLQSNVSLEYGKPEGGVKM
jgi:hypothetical protein